LSWKQQQDGSNAVGAWIENPLENRLILVKTENFGPDRFHLFLKNQSIKFNFSKNIKNCKKTRVYFKVFGQNQIQKFEQHVLQNLSKWQTVLKAKNHTVFSKTGRFPSALISLSTASMRLWKRGGCGSCAPPSSSSSFLGAINAAACVSQYVLHASSFLGAATRISPSPACKSKNCRCFLLAKKKCCCYLSFPHAGISLHRMLLTLSLLLVLLLILSRVLLALSLALAFMLVSSWARVQVAISVTIAVRSMRLGKSVLKNQKNNHFLF
jgi:hypothetical protein